MLNDSNASGDLEVFLFSYIFHKTGINVYTMNERVLKNMKNISIKINAKYILFLFN